MLSWPNDSTHASNVTDTPAAGCKSVITLRLTGLKEEEKEETDELLRQTAQVLGQLPNAVSSAGAIRQGPPSGNKARAVIITLASEADRAMVLRTKASLGRNDDTRHLSLNEVLNPDQQRQKNALWSVFKDARNQGRRASWRGCHLYIDGGIVPPPSPPPPPPPQVPFPMPTMTSSTQIPGLQSSTNVYSNPLAQSDVPHSYPQQIQSQPPYQAQPAWPLQQQQQYQQQQQQQQYQQPQKFYTQLHHIPKTPVSVRHQ